MDIHKKKIYAGDKTFIEGKAASFLYCSISHGLTSDIYEKIASIWYPPLFCGLIKFASASAYKPILTFIHTTRNNMSSEQIWNCFGVKKWKCAILICQWKAWKMWKARKYAKSKCCFFLQLEGTNIHACNYFVRWPNMTEWILIIFVWSLTTRIAFLCVFFFRWVTLGVCKAELWCRLLADNFWWANPTTGPASPQQFFFVVGLLGELLITCHSPPKSDWYPPSKWFPFV